MTQGMSLLVTSCTMGKQPNRLLNKGPQYLRTRTNASLFGENRKSAVELLAASKARFYTIRSPVSLDTHQDLAVSFGQQERYSKNTNSSKERPPVRSKSQYDLSQSQFATVEDGNDENNNDTSDDSINFSKADVLDDTKWPTLHQEVPVSNIKPKEARKPLSVFSSLTNEDSTDSLEKGTVQHSSKPQPKLIVLRTASVTTPDNDQIYVNFTAESKPQDLRQKEDGTTLKKPVPLPRKSKEKPIPPPRKPSVTPVHDKAKDSHVALRNVTSAPFSLYSHSHSSKNFSEETPKLTSQVSTPATDIRRKYSAVESLTKRFTALSASSPPLKLEQPHQLPKAERSPELKVASEISGKYTATPVFIHKSDTSNLSLLLNRLIADKETETSYLNSDTTTTNKNRKRCPDVTSSTRAVKRERRSIGSDTSYSKPGFVSLATSKFVPVERSNSSSTPRSEMSIESADQAVCTSEVSAIPAVSMDTEIVRSQSGVAREVTRSNSSPSGKIEHQDPSPIMVSPALRSSVPRSHSDIGCSSEGQHSRDSSLVSNHSRLSHTSIGADLENFFNQMGLEKGILEPMSRLKELQTGEVFDSISSLDSQDAASICSTYSRTEQEWADSRPLDRGQQQTSIVERNARIIKWLCNVKKAKNQLQKTDNVTTSKG